MRLMGYDVDKKIERGCKLIFCKDDEISWVVVMSRNSSISDNSEKIFLYENSILAYILCRDGFIGGKIQEINYDQKYIKIENTTIYEDDDISAVGIVGNDSRPYK